MNVPVPLNTSPGSSIAHDLRTRAEDVIPGGSSTGSKQTRVLYGSRSSDVTLPAHYERANGCVVYASDGRKYIDCTMALGAVGIGYADSAVTRAVVAAAQSGNVSGLPSVLEVCVAEQLIDVIPCAEQVRFLRTGAEANAAAIRLARTATNRTHVIACGYFGWLDWCSTAAGVPPDAQSHVTWIPFNDVAALELAIVANQHDLAALIIEPFVHDVASRDWLQAARAACDRTGAVLIYDEVKTAFRVRTGGVQELLGVLPDLTTIGKALANGYPLAAVVGRAAIMDVAHATWISSTAATESTGLAAAQAVLAWHDRVDVPRRMAEAGALLKDIVSDSLEASPWVGVRAVGPAIMWRLEAEQAESLDKFVAAAAHGGVLLKRGAYQFGAVAHDQSACDAIAEAMPSIILSVQRGPHRSEEGA